MLRIKYYRANSEICHRINAFDSSFSVTGDQREKSHGGQHIKRRGEEGDERLGGPGKGERLRPLETSKYISIIDSREPQQDHEVQTRGRGRKIQRRETKMKETNKSRGSHPSSSINSVKIKSINKVKN